MIGSLAAFKTRLDISDANDDSVLLAILEAVSGVVRDYCGRDFEVTAAGTARVFTAEAGDWCEIDDVVAVTAVKTNETSSTESYDTTWASTDYILMPQNDTPKRWIRTKAGGKYGFPTYGDGVQVTGTWGYSLEPPAPVVEAVYNEAARIFAQAESPSGVVASAELGQWLVMPSLHPTTRILLNPYRRMGVTA